MRWWKSLSNRWIGRKISQNVASWTWNLLQLSQLKRAPVSTILSQVCLMVYYVKFSQTNIQILEIWFTHLQSIKAALPWAMILIKPVSRMELEIHFKILDLWGAKERQWICFVHHQQVGWKHSMGKGSAQDIEFHWKLYPNGYFERQQHCRIKCQELRWPGSSSVSGENKLSIKHEGFKKNL